MKHPPIKLIKLQQIADGVDGFLTIVEYPKNLPFIAKRAFWITGFSHKKAIRGMHAHKKQEQFLVCQTGSFVLELYDGKQRTILKLNTASKGIYIGPNIWTTMTTFSKDCVILVFASDAYRESDYIRNFQDFTRRVNKK